MDAEAPLSDATVLERRVRTLLSPEPDLEEKRMFGGLAFMLAGHMACGVVKGRLVVRLGEDAVEGALEDHPHTRPMDFTGRVIRSMVYVEPEGWADEGELTRWVDGAVGFVRSLPPKR